MFDHVVRIRSSMDAIRLLNRMDLKLGRDFVAGPPIPGQDHEISLLFKNRDQAILFKLRNR